MSEHECGSGIMPGMEEVQLRWGPCDGDRVQVDGTDLEIRVPVVMGVCCEELPSNIGRDVYTEAIYIPDKAGVWWYSGRMRYRDDGGEAYFHPA